METPHAMTRLPTSLAAASRAAAPRAAALRTGAPRRRADAQRASLQISTLLVDDHTLIRQGVRVLLEAEDDIVVVGEAQDGRQAVEMARRLHPDVVVMDIAMPLLNGLEATRQILDSAPATRVLILSAHSDEEYVDRVTGLGAAGYVLKQSSLEDLAAAIRTAAAGRIYVSPSIARRPRRSTAGPPRGKPSQAPMQLTSREAEVLQLVAEGKANKQTAAQLGISIKTVEKHRQGLMRKLDIHDVAGLTRYAIAVGSIEGRDRSPTA
jgi:DNA-binding NarL/FixJ family response regulator